MLVQAAKPSTDVEVDRQSIDSLYAEHAEWARAVALGIQRRLWAQPVDPADCIQNAMVGLLEAAARFDVRRGVPFRAYAASRVRGAVFNGLRALVGTEMPRPSRDDERIGLIAESCSEDHDLDFFGELVGSFGLAVMVEEVWSAPSPEDASAFAEREEARAQLADAILALPERLRELLRQHYFLHRPFCEIAGAWGVTRGRISQLHHDALRHLRGTLVANR